eukprot:CFRG6629T1
MLSVVRIAGRSRTLTSVNTLLHSQHRAYTDGKVIETKSDANIAVAEPQNWSNSPVISSFNGVPEEHVKRECQIYIPARTAMSQGTFSNRKWRLDFEARERWENPTIGWSSSADPLSNLGMDFSTKEDAVAFANKIGWSPVVTEPAMKRFKQKSYGANFHWNKKCRVATK